VRLERLFWTPTEADSVFPITSANRVVLIYRRSAWPAAGLSLVVAHWLCKLAEAAIRS
jgi:hypothetical protein